MENEIKLFNEGKIEEGVNNVKNLAKYYNISIDEAVKILNPSEVVVDAIKHIENNFFQAEYDDSPDCVVVEFLGRCMYGNFDVSCLECEYLSKESLSDDEKKDFENFRFEEDIINKPEEDYTVPF